MTPKSGRIDEVMTRNILEVSEDTTLRDVAVLMKSHQIGDVLVTDQSGALCGIVTDRDLVVRSIAEGDDPDRACAGDICSKEGLVTVAPEATIDEAVQLMRERAIRRIPVVDGAGAVGIVSIGDLAQARDPDSALGCISRAQPTI